jgi:hypothetical protein
MTRRNDRRIVTTTGEPVRNRETWTVTATNPDGSLTLDRRAGPGTVVVPVGYVREHVRLGYAATEHGWQADTVEQLHRFQHRWEANASLRLRGGDPSAIDHYELHDRIHAGTFHAHVEEIADRWVDLTAEGRSVGIVASTNEHVDHLNRAVQFTRHLEGQLGSPSTPIAADEIAFVGDVVMTRRNDRRLATDTAPARSGLDEAERAARDAELALHASERRLDAAPRLHRRGRRHERDQAADRLTDAREHLAEVAVRTAPDVSRYEQAVTERNAADKAAHGLRIDAILEQWSVDEPTARQRVEALETWRSWADGKPVGTDQLVHTAEVLADLPDSSIAGLLYRQLKPSLPAKPVEPAQHLEPSLGIDLDF